MKQKRRALGFTLLYILVAFLHGQELPLEILEEPAPSFTGLDFGSDEVFLFIDGSWTLALGAGLRAVTTDTTGLDGALSTNTLGLSPFSIAQQVELSLSLWLLDQWYADVLIANNFEQLRFSLGYQSLDSRVHLALGNYSFATPAHPAGPGLSPEGLFGFSYSLADSGYEHGGGIRLSNYDFIRRSFVNGRENIEITWSMDQYNRNQLFVLGHSEPRNLQVMVEDPVGEVVSADGRRFSVLGDENWSLLPSGALLLERSARTTVAVYYSIQDQQWNESRGNQSFIIPSSDGSLTPQSSESASFDWTQDSPFISDVLNRWGDVENFSVEIEGNQWLILNPVNSPSPFESRGLYSGFVGTNPNVLIRSPEQYTSITKFTSQQLDSAVFFGSGGNDTWDILYPFYGTLPSLYSIDRAVEQGAVLVARSQGDIQSSDSELPLGLGPGDRIARITIDGVTLAPGGYRVEGGTLVLDQSPGLGKEVVVSYRTEGEQTSSAELSHSSSFSFSEHTSLDMGIQSTLPLDYNSGSSLDSLVFGDVDIGLAFNTSSVDENATLKGTLGVGAQFYDPTSFVNIDGSSPEKTEFIPGPGTGHPWLGSPGNYSAQYQTTSYVPPPYRETGTSDTARLSYLQSRDITTSPSVMGPYSVNPTDDQGTAQISVVDLDLAPGQWSAVRYSIPQVHSYIAAVTTTFGAMVSSGSAKDLEVIIELGLLSEDLDQSGDFTRVPSTSLYPRYLEYQNQQFRYGLDGIRFLTDGSAPAEDLDSDGRWSPRDGHIKEIVLSNLAEGTIAEEEHSFDHGLDALDAMRVYVRNTGSSRFEGSLLVGKQEFLSTKGLQVSGGLDSHTLFTVPNSQLEEALAMERVFLDHADGRDSEWRRISASSAEISIPLEYSPWLGTTISGLFRLNDSLPSPLTIHFRFENGRSLELDFNPLTEGIYRWELSTDTGGLRLHDPEGNELLVELDQRISKEIPISYGFSWNSSEITKLDLGPVLMYGTTNSVTYRGQINSGLYAPIDLVPLGDGISVLSNPYWNQNLLVGDGDFSGKSAAGFNVLSVPVSIEASYAHDGDQWHSLQLGHGMGPWGFGPITLDHWFSSTLDSANNSQSGAIELGLGSESSPLIQGEARFSRSTLSTQKAYQLNVASGPLGPLEISSKIHFAFENQGQELDFAPYGESYGRWWHQLWDDPLEGSLERSYRAQGTIALDLPDFALSLEPKWEQHMGLNQSRDVGSWSLITSMARSLEVNYRRNFSGKRGAQSSNELSQDFDFLGSLEPEFWWGGSTIPLVGLVLPWDSRGYDDHLDTWTQWNQNQDLSLNLDFGQRRDPWAVIIPRSLGIYGYQEIDNNGTKIQELKYLGLRYKTLSSNVFGINGATAITNIWQSEDIIGDFDFGFLWDRLGASSIATSTRLTAILFEPFIQLGDGPWRTVRNSRVQNPNPHRFQLEAQLDALWGTGTIPGHSSNWTLELAYHWPLPRPPWLELPLVSESATKGSYLEQSMVLQITQASGTIDTNLLPRPKMASTDFWFDPQAMASGNTLFEAAYEIHYVIPLGGIISAGVTGSFESEMYSGAGGQVSWVGFDGFIEGVLEL